MKLHYEIKGQGPRIVMIQGVGVIGRGWQPQVDFFSKSFTTLTFDNRGIGKSASCQDNLTIDEMAKDVAAIMDELGWESAHIVGHSMGGVIAQQFALNDPHRAKSLSLLCTFARGRDAARVTPRILWLGIRSRLGPKRLRRKAFLEMLIPPKELKSLNSDNLANQFAPLIGRDLAESPPILMKQLQALGRHDCSARLSELGRIPTLVLSSEHDPIALPEYGQQLASAIPHSKFEVLPGVSHGVTLHRPELVNARLERFLSNTE